MLSAVGLFCFSKKYEILRDHRGRELFCVVATVLVDKYYSKKDIGYEKEEH